MEVGEPDRRCVRRRLLPERGAYPGFAYERAPDRPPRTRVYERRCRRGPRRRRAAPGGSARRAAPAGRRASGSGTAISWSSRPGERSAGIDGLGPAGGTDDRDAAFQCGRHRLPEHGRQRTGLVPRHERLDVGDEHDGRRRPSAVSAVRSRAAASLFVSAAISGAQSVVTCAFTTAATACTIADLPEPGGPVTSTPSEIVVPRRPSTSPWWKPRSSSSVSSCACFRSAGQVVEVRPSGVRPGAVVGRTTVGVCPARPARPRPCPW